MPYSNLMVATLPLAVTSPTNLWIGGEDAAPAVLTGTGITLAGASVMLGPNLTVVKGTTLTVIIK